MLHYSSLTKDTVKDTVLMTATYTNHKGIKAAKPPQTDHTEYKDATTTGLYLRVYSTGLKVFVHRFKIKGKRYVLTLDTAPELTMKSSEGEISKALTTARANHATQRASIKNGGNPAIERNLKTHHIATMPTVSEFADTFIVRHMGDKKSGKEYRRILNVDVLPFIGDMPIDKVEKKHIASLTDRKQDAGAMVARNMLIAVLSRLFTFAGERGILDDNFNPVRGIKKTNTKARERVLSEREIRMLWDYTSPSASALDPATRLALRLVLVTGQRPGEVCQIQDNQLDGNDWHIPDTKNGTPHDVYLTPTALQIIEEVRPHGRNGYLFVNRKGGMKDEKTLANSISEWAIQWDDNHGGKPTPHDLRRTFTTGLGSLGFSRFIQNLVTNHIDRTVSGRYDRHMYTKERQQAQEAWERRLLEIVTGEPLGNVVEFRRVG